MSIPWNAPSRGVAGVVLKPILNYIVGFCQSQDQIKSCTMCKKSAEDGRHRFETGITQQALKENHKTRKRMSFRLKNYGILQGFKTEVTPVFSVKYQHSLRIEPFIVLPRLNRIMYFKCEITNNQLSISNREKEKKIQKKEEGQEKKNMSHKLKEIKESKTKLKEMLEEVNTQLTKKDKDSNRLEERLQEANHINRKLKVSIILWKPFLHLRPLHYVIDENVLTTYTCLNITAS